MKINTMASGNLLFVFTGLVCLAVTSNASGYGSSDTSSYSGGSGYGSGGGGGGYGSREC